MARNKKVEILSNSQEVLHPMTDGDCVIFEDGQTLTQKLSEDDSVKYTPEIVNSSPMFKVGEGNTVNYSDNALDGAYERATLQGQTYVNYIQESSADEVTLPTPFTEYERTQHNTLTSDEEGVLGINLVGQSYVNALQHDSEEEFVVLGESLEFQEKKVEYTNEGQIKSAMLKGQTLVNLVIDKEKSKYVELKPNAGLFAENIKPNTTYTVMLNYTVKNANNSLIVQAYNGDSYISNIRTITTTETKQKFLMTIPNDNTINRFRIVNPMNGENNIVLENVVVVEGDYTNIDIPYFQGMQSVTVSTRLENLCHKHTTSSLAKTGKTFKSAGSINDRVIQLINLQDGNASSIYGMKPNTKYLVQFKISNLVLDGLSSLAIQFSTSTIDSGNSVFVNGTINNLINSNGVYRVVLTTSDILETSNIEIKGIAAEWESSGSSLRSMTISEIMYVEYQNGMENWNLPYFEDYQVIKPVQVESASKNKFNTRNANRVYGCTPTFHNDNSFTLVGSNDNPYKSVGFLINVKPNTEYRLSYSFERISGTTDAFYDVYSADNKYLAHHGNPINTGNNTQLSIRFYVNSDNTKNGTIRYYDIQMEEGNTTTEYVPHQSKTTYSWDEVILRKVGDVEDTLDLTTGEWVQRIGEVTLDGSETWKMDAEASANNSCMFYTGVDFGGFQHFEHYEDREKYQLCDKFKIKADTYYLDENCIMVNQDARIYCRILKTQLSSPDVTGFQEWLKTNNVKISTLLAKPIVHKVNLSRPNLQVYDDITHVHTKCLDGTLIPNIYLPSDVSYPAILEPNKTYNVCVNHTEVSADNPLKVNVGGTEITMTDSRMTLTTPATLANSNVSFTGKGNKIKESMLIKNSSLLTRDLPHFNGIGSVQLGKTIENLCSASGFKAGSSDAKITWYDNYAHTNISAGAGSCVFVYELVKRLENGKKYFVYSPINLTGYNRAVSFRNLYNNTLIYSKQATQIDSTYKNIIEINQEENFYTHVVVGCHYTMQLNTEFDTYRPIICEYEPGMENWDWESIGYFTGTKNIGNEFMRVQNKNLFDGKLELGGYTGTTGEKYSATDRVRSTTKVFLKAGTYYLSSPNATTIAFNLYNMDNTFRQEHASKSNSVKLILEKEAYSHITVVTPDLLNAQIQLEESSTATTYTAHKHNSLHILPNEQIPLTFEQGAILFSNTTSFAEQINNIMTTRIRTGLLDLEPNETYRISFGDKNYICGIAFYDNSNIGFNAVSEISKDYVFTTTKNVHKICINIARSDMDANITPSVLHQVRLEKVTDVHLRGIGDVQDELDITRGIYTQRIGEIVLDGSDDEIWYPSGLNQDLINAGHANIVFYYNQQNNGTIPNLKISPYDSMANIICDKLQSVIHKDQLDANFRDCSSICGGATATELRIAIPVENSAAQQDSAACKAWLKENPIKVQYELATPIIHKVHIGNKNEANTEIAKPNDVFTLPTLYTEQTHIDLTNNGIVPKVQSRDYIAYPVTPMISRTYTLQHNLTGGVSNLTVDLLGRTQQITYQNHKSLVYSPETMDAVLHNGLRISGKGKISGVMYIDGGYMDRDIPYIEGMKNAVNPIVKNVGKNLFDGELEMGSIYLNNGVNYDSIHTIRTKNFVPVKSSTQYILTNDKNYQQNIIFYDEQQRAISHCSNTIAFITPINAKYLRFRCAEHLEQKDLNTKFQLEEGSVTTPYIEYKENICYVDCGEIRLTPDMFEQGSVGAANVGSHYNSDKADSSYRIRTKELIKLEIGEQYVFLGNNDKYKYSVRFYDMNGNKVSHSTTYDLSWKGTTPFTILNDAPMCAFFIKKANDSVITVDDTEAFNFQLVKVSEIKQLRSLPNGVHDEIDLENGTYTQRVGEITFNGTESWIVGYATWDNKRTYYNNSFVDIKTFKGDNGSGQAYYDALRCPQLHRSYMSRLASAAIDGVASYYYSGYQRIFISKQDCATVDELKLWLQENPITVQYELPEPIVKDIVIHNYPHSYEGGHVIIENGDSNTPIPAQLTYRAVTNRSGQIQQHTEQVEKQEREINELETLILANIHLSQTR